METVNIVEGRYERLTVEPIEALPKYRLRFNKLNSFREAFGFDLMKHVSTKG
jgi:hypothetical protein